MEDNKWVGSKSPYSRLAARVSIFAALLALAPFQSMFASGSSGGSTGVIAPVATVLTQDLLRLAAQHRAVGATERRALLPQLQNTARLRAELLSASVADDPAEVIRVAIPTSIRAQLPPAVRALVEERVELEGELEVYVEDSRLGHRYEYALRTSIGRFALHFASGAPTMITGSRIRVRGVRVGEALALESGADGASFQTLSAALPNTFGTQVTAVILVNFQDNPVQPYSLAHAREVVFTSTSDFDWEVSYEQTQLSGQVYGWYTIALDSSSCDPGKISSLARSAATAAGADLSDVRRFVYGFPTNACSWWGYGTVGGTPSHAWIKGSFQLRVVAHEMGHSFGLYHSRALSCGSEVLGPSCTVSEYGDLFDVMGGSSAHFNAFQKERLGWLGHGISPAIEAVNTSGTYWIEPYQNVGTGPKALKVLQSVDPSSGKSTWYYLEHRRALGFDSFLASNSNVLNGIVMHLGSESSARSIDLLDLTPETTTFSDAALVVGRTYYDPVAGVTMQPLSAGPAGASVQIHFAAPDCVAENPEISVTPAQGRWAVAGTTVSYGITVTNRDSIGCGSSSFDLMAEAAPGWEITLTSQRVSAAPGYSASTTMFVTSPPSASDGFHEIPVRVAAEGAAEHLAESAATYVVLSSLDLSISTDAASYSLGQSVQIDAVVGVAGALVAGATVDFTVIRPDGSNSSQSATTGADGRASVIYRSKKRDPAGQYRVYAQGASNGVTGTATTTFLMGAESDSEGGGGGGGGGKKGKGPSK